MVCQRITAENIFPYLSWINITYRGTTTQLVAKIDHKMRASSVGIALGIATCASFATCCRADAFSRQQRQQQAAEV